MPNDDHLKQTTTVDDRLCEGLEDLLAELASDEHVSTPETQARFEPIYQSVRAKLAELERAQKSMS
jgi:hypothetical protein